MNQPIEEWEKYIKELPDEVRLGLANYTAQSFLDGVAQGKKDERLSIIKQLEGLKIKMINNDYYCAALDDALALLTSHKEG